MWLFSWIQDKKIRKIDPFWALMALVKADNSKETLKFALDKADREAITESVPFGPKSPEEDKDDKKDDEKGDEDDDSEKDFSDEEDQELYYFYHCIGCKIIFRKKEDLYKHLPKCDKL